MWAKSVKERTEGRLAVQTTPWIVGKYSVVSGQDVIKDIRGNVTIQKPSLGSFL